MRNRTTSGNRNRHKINLTNTSFVSLLGLIDKIDWQTKHGQKKKPEIIKITTLTEYDKEYEIIAFEMQQNRPKLPVIKQRFLLDSQINNNMNIY